MGTVFIGIPLIIFMGLVAPLWLFLHYRSKRQTGQGLNSEDIERLQALANKAEQMQSRVETLERILDAEAPDWRRS
ncbi:envelope stress response membrane protein PspB [Aliivibrio kagoshimensis]|jgi:phage shock protein B|uniref:envelope stress response membrane protein PspB n=1 Tax=Aliivibrio kagoshimensis TaxID=2910230 RepID=UPI003D14E58F